MAHINHFFRLDRLGKSSASKGKSRQASCHFKRVLGAAMLKKQCNSQKLGSRNYCQITNNVLNKVNLLYLPYLPASVKAKLHAKSFSDDSNLDDSGISLPTCPSRTYQI